MKKTIMKIGKMAAVTAFMIFAVSCTKEMIDDPQQTLRAGVKRHISASAEMPGQGSAKAYLNTTNGKVAWQLGDEINVNGTAMHEIMLHNDFAAPQAVFEGTVNAMQSLTSDEEIYWAVYPKTLSELNSNGIPNDFQETSLTFDLPATQNYSTANPTLAGSTYMAGLARMEAGNTDVYFHMKNLGAILCLKLTAANGIANTNTSRIEFSTTNGALAGKFTMDDDTVTVTPTATATKNLSVNLSDGTNSYIDIATEALVYVYLPPMAAKDLTITIYNTDDSYTQKTVSSATLVRSRIYTTTINNIAFDDYSDYYYSVSPTRKVVFSRGNLQWSATGTHNTVEAQNVRGTWRFAPNQWDVIGEDNENIDTNYTGWIDLFGWGTSGYHNPNDNGNRNNQPFSTMHANTGAQANYYGYGPSFTQADNNIAGANANYDWGIYNDIFNPRTQKMETAGTWFTLSYDEYTYLMDTRVTPSGIRYAVAQVNGVNGLILVPDLWESSTHTFTRPNEITIAYNSNVINLATWKLLEKKGCTFLPVAGYRIGNVYHRSTAVGDLYGHQYWSTTSNAADSKDAWALTTYSTSNRVVNRDRYYGHSVRLVKEYVAD